MTIFTSRREKRLQYSSTPQASAWVQHFLPSLARHSSALTSAAKDMVASSFSLHSAYRLMSRWVSSTR